MNKIFFLLKGHFIACLLLISVTVNAEELLPDKLKQIVLDNKYSHHSSRWFGEQCVTRLKEHFQSGKNLSSNLISSQIIDFEAYKKTNKTFMNNEVYHYTDYQAYIDLFKPDELDRDFQHDELVRLKIYESIFDYKKKSSTLLYNAGANMAMSTGIFYVGTNPIASNGFGHIQLSFTVSNKAKIFIFGKEDVENKWQAIEEEVTKLYPKIFSNCIFRRVSMLVLEESGVDIMEYNRTEKWLQVFNPKIIVGSDIVVYGKEEHFYQDKIMKKLKERTKDRIYNVSPFTEIRSNLEE